MTYQRVSPIAWANITTTAAPAAAPVRAGRPGPGPSAVGTRPSRGSGSAGRTTVAPSRIPPGYVTVRDDPAHCRAEDVRGDRQRAVARVALAGTAAPGGPVDGDIRSQMESILGEDFGPVRVRTGESGAVSAALLGAVAYTVGEDIVLGGRAPAPATAEGRRLLAHELTHVAQQRRGVNVPGGIGHPTDAYERQARAVAGRASASGPAVRTGLPGGSRSAPGAPIVVQREPQDPSQIPGHPDVPAPADFIRTYRLRNLMKPGHLTQELAERLFWLMWQGEDHYPFVEQVLEELRDDNLDNDVADAIVLGAHEQDLDNLSESPAGRALLDSMYEHIITGHLSGEDEQAARKILQAKTRQIPMESFITRAERAQIFPVRQMGLTVYDDSPLEAWLLPNGNIKVKLMARVAHTSDFAEEARTLRGNVFGEGEELRPDELIGVKDYDLNGEIEFYPAAALLMLANKTDTSTWGTIRNTIFTGASFGLGGAAAATTRLARYLLWADRAAAVISTVGTIINEHRRWAVSTFGEGFVRAVDIANNIVAVYGVARLAHVAGSAGVALTTGIKNRWRAFRAKPDFAQLEAAAATKDLVADLDHAIEKLPDPPTHAADPVPGAPAADVPARQVAAEDIAPAASQPAKASPPGAAGPLRRMGTRMLKGMDEWAETPGGGAGVMGAKEADEALKAGWRKVRKIKPKVRAKGATRGAGAAGGAKTATPKAVKAKPPTPKAPGSTAAKPRSAPPNAPGASPATLSAIPGIGERVLTGALNEHGQATFVTGELLPSDLHTGTPTGGYYPPGAVRGELKPLKAVRGHLLGDLFGGKGTEPGNLAWLHEWVNNSPYKVYFENPVRAALEHGETVHFDIQAHFEPHAAAPYAVEVWAKTKSGQVIVTHRTIPTPGMSHLPMPPMTRHPAADLPVPPNQER